MLSSLASDDSRKSGKQAIAQGRKQNRHRPLVWGIQQLSSSNPITTSIRFYPVVL